ncbi:cytochrome P450 [Abortiporus biennis]|nr:cytochrome P450 [Abortiporus biennis]
MHEYSPFLGQAIGALFLTWVCWKLLQAYVVHSPLDYIPGPRAPSLLLGHLKQMVDRKNGWPFMHELSTEWNAVVKIKELYNKNSLFVFDPVAMHSILIKDNAAYEYPSMIILTRKLLFGDGLLSSAGSQHKKQRKMLNPVFSINHMRHLTPVFYQIVHRLETALEGQVRNGAQETDMLNWFGRTALELIGQGGLGHSFDPLIEDRPNPFGEALKELIPAVSRLGKYRTILQTVLTWGTPSLRRRVAEHIPSRRLKHAMHIVDTLTNQCQEIYEAKKKGFLEGDESIRQQMEGKDIMSILLRANMTAAEEDRLPENELIGQMAALVFAATDTTSSALSRTLYLLSDHQDVQGKLREEIIAAQDDNGGDIPYDQIVDLPYLDAICRETLRLWCYNEIVSANLNNRKPPLMYTYDDFRAAQDTILPLLTPIVGTHGKVMTEIPVPKGTSILIGIRAANRNKAIWGEDAMEWKPERFLSPVPESVTEARIPGVYSNLMTFSGGVRSCIGFKFSQLEMKIVLAVLISKFRFSPSEKHQDIVWNSEGVEWATVGLDGRKPMLPMRVELVVKS